MPEPVIGDYGEALYEELEPIHHDVDEDNGWSLRAFLGGLAAPHDVVRAVAIDETDKPALSALYDPDRCPAAFLGWLAQHMGVRLPVGVSEATAREMIKNPAGLQRCSTEALIAAVKLTLTGDKHVGFVERQDDSFWKQLLVTRPAETPDADSTYRAALTQKRGGVVLTHVVTDVVLIDELTGDIDDLPDDIDDL